MSAANLVWKSTGVEIFQQKTLIFINYGSILRNLAEYRDFYLTVDVQPKEDI